MKDIINIAVVNFRLSSAGKSSNQKRIIEYSEAACRRGADLILFPEMCSTGIDIFLDPETSPEGKAALADAIDGDFSLAVARVSTKYDAYIIYGAPEIDTKTKKLYNSAFIAGPEGIIGTYRKIHTFAGENTWCSRGEDPFMFDTPWGPIGIGICYDSYQFPELIRFYANKGSRLYLNLSAECEEVTKRGSRESFYNYYSLLEAAVRCNYMYIASANLTGYDKKTYFAGGSCVIGPKTDPFFETDAHYYGGSKENTQETIEITTVDLSLATRALFTKGRNAKEPAYQPEIYRKLL